VEKLLKKLLNHLDNEVEFLSVYLTALRDQTKHVVSGDYEQVHNNLNILFQLLHQNRSLKHSIMLILQDLAAALNVSPKQITLTKIIGVVNSTWAERLTHRRDKFLSVIFQIQQEVEKNKFLLNYTMDFNRSLITILDKSNPIYSPNGRRSLPKKMLDQKA